MQHQEVCEKCLLALRQGTVVHVVAAQVSCISRHDDGNVFAIAVGGRSRREVEALLGKNPHEIRLSSPASFQYRHVQFFSLSWPQPL